MKEVRILGPEDVRARLLRLAYEIYERNFRVDAFSFIGVDERGLLLAEHLARLLRDISSREVDVKPLPRLELDKSGPPDWLADFEGRQIFLVDDVLYTGKTLYDALTRIMHLRPSSVRSVVLIDRGHRSLPVAADHIGLELATTLQEYVFVRYEDNSQAFSAYLS